MYCPITKNECVEKSCAWFIEDVEQCAIKSIAESAVDADMFENAARNIFTAINNLERRL